MAGVDDRYFIPRLASARSLLHRLEQQHEAAVKIIQALSDRERPDARNQSENSAIGSALLQQALNYIQVERLAEARQLLSEWGPIDHKPSVMEQVVEFRINVLLGKISRFEGRFDESRAKLKRSFDLMERLPDLSFDEDRRDLTCDMADTLRELDEPQCAEMHVRKELKRWDLQGQILPGRSLLEVCLAEMLFAQGRMEEAGRLCTNLESRSNLLKLGRLRMYIVLAKIHHTRGEHGKAAEYWGKTMKCLIQFPLSNGHTLRVVMLSMEKMHCLPPEGLDRSMQQLDLLATLSRPGGTRYWIAGMRHWEKFLGT